jgi:hypothetical protein
MSQGTVGSVTTIDSNYLKSLVNNTLVPLLDQVSDLLNPSGYSGQAVAGGPFITVSPITGSISVMAGGVPGSNGSTGFDIADGLNDALKTMGTSVQGELEWLDKVLTDMISEINTTITQMQGTDNLNAMDAQTLAQDFQNTITDVNNVPGSGSSSGGGSGGSGGGGSGGNGGGNGNGNG